MLANRVLLVDDDEVVRLTLTGLLEQSGFAVTCASNVMEALKVSLQALRRASERSTHARRRRWPHSR